MSESTVADAPPSPPPADPVGKEVNGGGGPAAPWIGQVWSRRKPIAFLSSVSTIGGIAAPLLAGFSLTTVVQIATSSSPPRFDEATMAFFSLAAALLLYSVQFTGTAQSYSATPTQRLEYFPEALKHDAVLSRVRKDQWREMELRTAYVRRATITYNYGIIAFFLGLAAVLVPHGDWNVGHVVAIAVALAGAAIELSWAVSKGKFPPQLLPTTVDESKVVPHRLEDEGRDRLSGSTEVEELLREIRNLLRKELRD